MATSAYRSPSQLEVSWRRLRLEEFLAGICVARAHDLSEEPEFVPHSSCRKQKPNRQLLSDRLSALRAPGLLGSASSLN